MSTPLPLASFERYMLADSRPGHPMTCFVRLRFLGLADRERMDRALRAALERHPLLRATVQPGRWCGKQWVVGEAGDVPLNWRTGGGGALSEPVLMDLEKAPGLCVLGVNHSRKTDLIFQFHHSCCDGVGIFRFIEDMLICYAENDGCMEMLPPLDQDQLQGRGMFGLTPLKLARMLPRQMIGLKGVCQFLMRSPQPLSAKAGEDNCHPLPKVFPECQSISLSQEESLAILATARQNNATVNDVLVRDMFLALRQWRRTRGMSKGREWIRLSIPINLRLPEQATMPAANVVSMVFLDRQPRQMDRDDLLSGIHDEMQLIKENQLGLTFIWSIKAFSYVPGISNRLIRTSGSHSTCVLSNMGQLFRNTPLPRQEKLLQVGELVLSDVDILSPLRRGTHAAIVAYKYAGTQRFTLRHDPNIIGAKDAKELTATYASFLAKASSPK